MSDSESNSSAVPKDVQRKRKRSVDFQDGRESRANPAPREYIDMTESCSTVAPGQNPTSSQLDSQLQDSQSQQLRSLSASDYVASTRAEDAPSLRAPGTDTSSSLRPLPSISTRVFEPYLDDTTGMDLEVAESGVSRDRARAEPGQVERSSPVESFSPAEEVQSTRNACDVPRIGTWILPELTAENSNPNMPDYSSQHVLGQIPLDMDVDQRYDLDDLYGESAASQLSPSLLNTRLSRTQQVHRQGAGGSSVAASVIAGATSPIQSTPAFASDAAASVAATRPPPDAQSDALLPSQPIASQQQESRSATPALPPTTNTTMHEPAPRSTGATGTSDASRTLSSSVSIGWSALPRAEIVELVHESTQIPGFLKDEIERFVLRADRASSPKSSAPPQRGSPRRRFQSQSQNSSNNNDDSETQEDGLLRTKKVWCMDLLVFAPSGSRSTAAGGGVSAITSDVVRKLTQQTQASQACSSGSGVSQRGAVAILLLLDTVNMTFDVHELEESLASVLRNDRRYSVGFDVNGRRWNAEQGTDTCGRAGTLVDATRQGDQDELEETRVEIVRLQSALESASREIETLSETQTTLKKELAESQSQHDFVRSLYERASASALSAQASASAAHERVRSLQAQLDDGLALHRSMLELGIETWKNKLQRLEAQSALAHKQQQHHLADAAEIRKKAALWDAHQAHESELERHRQQRIRLHDEKQRMRQDASQAIRRAAATGGDRDGDGGGDGDSGGGGPFAPPPVPVPGEREPSPMDELDELAALAREAAEAGDTLIIQDTASAGGSRRTRRARGTTDAGATQGAQRKLGLRNASNRAPPYSGVQMAAQVEAAKLSSANALDDSRQELEDQFAMFDATPSAQDEQSGVGAATVMMRDFDAAPSTSLFSTDDLFEQVTAHTHERARDFDASALDSRHLEVDVEPTAQAHHGDMPAWDESSTSIPLPPSFTQGSMLLLDTEPQSPPALASSASTITRPETSATGQASTASQPFQPHTQA